MTDSTFFSIFFVNFMILFNKMCSIAQVLRHVSFSWQMALSLKNTKHYENTKHYFWEKSELYCSDVTTIKTPRSWNLFEMDQFNWDLHKWNASLFQHRTLDQSTIHTGYGKYYYKNCFTNLLQAKVLLTFYLLKHLSRTNLSSCPLCSLLLIVIIFAYESN